MAIQTVNGLISSDELGVVTAHEHIFIDLRDFYVKPKVDRCNNSEYINVTMDKLGILSRDPYAIRDNLLLDDYKLQMDEILYFKKAGGSTIVDVTTDGIGRNVVELKKMSNDTGLNIIVGTGYYVGDSHPEEIKDYSIEEIANLINKELTQGIGNTNIKAGIIGEIGVSYEIKPEEIKMLKASALAYHYTGTAIHVHINPWSTQGINAADILLKEGVPANRICIDHVDVENRECYIYSLLEKGVYIEFDNFGKEYYVDRKARHEGYGCFASDRERVSLLSKLIRDGYTNRILLSCDICLKNLLHAYGGWGYDHVLTNIIPMMDEEGISPNDIRTMLCMNPANFLDSHSNL